MKCPICKKRFGKKKDVLNHMSVSHITDIPTNMSPAKYYYSLNHGGKTHGTCRICSDPTDFNEQTGLTKVFCNNPKCKEQFAKIAQERNIKKFGVPHLLNNQAHQMKMLSNRKISGEYIWSNGKAKIPYVGSYERRFLEFLDIVMDWDPTTIFAPCPFDVYYEYQGDILTHTPDFYIDILDLIVEIKHGGKNPNTHPKIQMVDVEKDKLKEEAIKTKTEYNYIKIVDNDFNPLIKMIFNLTEDVKTETKVRRIIINESVDSNNAINNLSQFNDLFITFYGEKITNGLSIIDFCLSTKLNDNKYIVFKNNKLEYVTDPETIDAINKGTLAVYKYTDEINIQKNINTLLDSISTTQFNEVSYIEILPKLFPSVFGNKTITIVDIITNTKFSKLAKVKSLLESKEAVSVKDLEQITDLGVTVEDKDDIKDVEKHISNSSHKIIEPEFNSSDANAVFDTAITLEILKPSRDHGNPHQKETERTFKDEKYY